jgi:hypothetical protein
MQVDLGNALQRQVEYITRIEPNKTLAWGMKNNPDDPIQAVRTQTLAARGTEACSYISIDEFSGESAPVMIELMGKAVETGFNSCAYGLKEYAEALFEGEVT